jgi:hypothetical protein
MLVRTLAERGITLGIHCGALHYWSPNYSLTPEESALLRERAHETILEIMRTVQPHAPLREHAVPLTFQQEFALEHFGDFYGGAESVRISGPLNVDALSRSIYSLVERHSALHTKIQVTAQGLQQHIGPAEHRELEVLDLQESAPGSDAFNSCYCNLVREWYDAAESTFEVKLLRLSNSEHVLMVFWDHLFNDYYSASFLYQELWTSYCSVLRQQHAPVPSAPMQYSDYAMWQRQTYPSWAVREEVYWKERLRNAVPIQVSGSDSKGVAPPAKLTNVRIPLALSSSLRDVAQRIGVSTSFVVVPLISLALAIWTNQRKLTLPMTFSSRDQRKHLDMIGYLPNFVPLRVELADHDTFGQLCKAMSREYLTGIAHLNGKAMDGGRRELINAPFVQWFPSTPDEVFSPPRCRGDLEALGLCVKLFTPGSFNLPVLGRSRQAEFLPGLMLWEERGCIVGDGVFPFDLCPPAQTEARAPDLLQLATRVARDMDTSLASLLT